MVSPNKFGAVTFDTFGTLVDRHGAIAREVSRLLVNHALDADTLATVWNARIQSAMKPVRDGERAWVSIDTMEAETCARGLRSCHGRINQAWHQLDAWPEVTEALKRIRKRHLVANFPTTTSPRRLCIAMPFLGLGTFPVVETLFVAAHSEDINGALAACPGNATAHVSRPKSQGVKGRYTLRVVTVRRAEKPSSHIVDVAAGVAGD